MWKLAELLPCKRCGLVFAQRKHNKCLPLLLSFTILSRYLFLSFYDGFPNLAITLLDATARTLLTCTKLWWCEHNHSLVGASHIAVSNLPAMQETWKWQPTPVSCLENSMDRGAWQATVHGLQELDMTSRYLFFLFYNLVVSLSTIFLSQYVWLEFTLG